MQRTVTVRDIAARAGTSLSAVSYALNDRAGLVNPQKRDRILAIARELGYRPSRQARQMRRQSNMTLAIQLDSSAVSDNAWRSTVAQSLLILRGISDTAASHGYHLHLFTTGSEQDYREFEKQVLEENALDGVVFMGFRKRDGDQQAVRQWLPKLLERMRSLRLPAVSIDEALAPMGVSMVTVNLEPAVREAVQRLHALGHRRVAYVGIDYALTNEQESRLSTFRRVLAEAGIGLPDEWIIPTRIEIDGYRHTQSLLEARPLPDCVLYSGDHLAMAGIQAALDRGLRVPEDVSMLGMDYAPYAASSPVGLASLNKYAYERGQMIVELLLDQVEQPNRAKPAAAPARTEVDARFVDGPSLGPVRSTVNRADAEHA